MTKEAIFFADDDSFFTRFVPRELNRCGFDVQLVASTADEILACLGQLSEKGIRVAILDGLLGFTLNGSEICRRIKDNPDTKDIMVINISAIGPTAIPNADFHCNKAEGLDALVTLVRQALSKSV